MEDRLPAVNTPDVSVVVVNYNGLRHLEACLGSLERLQYPTEHLELILVDNGSTDGSVELVRGRFPAVRIISNTGNLGFARGNNIGVSHARGAYVAFLNNDMRVDPQWLTHLTAALRREEGIVSTTSSILSWDGKKIDFAGGYLNFYGHGMQPDFGAPLAVGSLGDTPKRVPFPCGGAMLIDREVFTQTGGFDDDFFAFFEDTDLGWRLWVLGYDVLYVPEAMAYHRHHATARSIPAHQLRVLYERNALFSLIKNYEQHNLDRVLPAALLLMIERCLLEARVDRDAYRLGATKNGTSESVRRVGISGLLAAEEVIDHLPRLLHKRELVQSQRRRSDREVFELWDIPLFHPNFPGAAYARAQDRLVATMEIDRVIANSARKRALLICHEPIGRNMAGPAVRFWEMARVLAQQFEVKLAHPGEEAGQRDGFQLVTFDRSDFESLAPLITWCDAIVAYGYLLHAFPGLGSCGKPLALDIYDIFTLENLEHHRQVGRGDQMRITAGELAVLNTILRAGDFFTCASERQRDFWLGMLSANGRLNPAVYDVDRNLRSLVDVVPFGVRSVPPQRAGRALKGVHPKIGTTDKVLLWGGGLWDWFDPETLIKAVARALTQRADIKLYFMAKQHLDSSVVPEMCAASRAVDLARQLGLLDEHVFFGNWVPYEERANYLLEADLGVSAHREGVEAHFAFRTRLLDYIWAGLPVVTTGGDELGDMIAKEGLGRTVRPGDVDGMADAILEALDDDGLRPRLAHKFAEVSARLTWEEAVGPLVRFLANPSAAADRRGATHSNSASSGMNSIAASETRPTPYVLLPLKAWRSLRQGGLRTLVWEMQQYVRWWRIYRP